MCYEREVAGSVVACLIVGMMACQSGMPGGAPVAAIGRPECPSDSLAITFVEAPRKDRTGSTAPQLQTIHKISLAGDISTVPEFHDCQEFVRGDGYLRLYAIFARFHLGSLADSLDTARYSPQKRALAAAEIYSDGESYPALGVEPYFNCLYVYRVLQDWRATMVPIGTHEADCLNSLPDPASKGTALEVHRVTPSTDLTAYPPVARWDWDGKHGQQYIGIMCGAGWCDIGAKGFVSTPTQVSGPAFDKICAFPWTAAQAKQVYAIKGWYDEQVLATPASSSMLHPGPVHGVIIPNPVLGQLDQATDFHPSCNGPWVHVAYAVVTGAYSSKLQLQSGWNKIYLCYGSGNDCGVPPIAQACSPAGMWWAKIKPPGFWQKPTYRCVTQRLHSNVTVPGAVRWRWLVNDETGWIRCQNGCCQIN